MMTLHASVAARTAPSPRQPTKMPNMPSHLRRLRRSVRTAAQLQQHTLVHGSSPSIAAMPRCLPSSCRQLQVSAILHQRAVVGDDNEAVLMQQMLDAMSLDGDEEENKNQQVVHVDATLPVHGVVLDIKNNIASISGLRHATLGSVVAVYNRAANDNANSNNSDANANNSDANANDRVCRGIVLFLEKKVAHVALVPEADDAARANVQIGMQVQLEDVELRVPMSLARLGGRVINPLGDVVTELLPADDDVVPTANDQVTVAWGSKTVPSLMSRGPLREPFATGILAIDCLKPLALGHRFGILGPRNSGKTRLMLDIIANHVKIAQANNSEPPHFVYVCVGKSPLRVKQIVEFLDHTGALPFTTIVSADERDTPIMQYLAPFTGCAVAEYYVHHGKSTNAAVVYDDLATHTTVVENLVQTMKLPKISQLSLSAHTILMERSAQFLKPLLSSITTFAVADTPDSATGEVSEFMERVKSIVDDSIVLEGHLSRNRVYPPIDVLMPGGSVRGAPFQSVAMWTYMNRIRTRINHASQTKENIEVAKQLGLEIEPEDAEVLEYQELVRQFFTQAPLSTTDKIQKELGVFALATVRVSLLSAGTSLNDVVNGVVQLLKEDNPELLHVIEAHPFLQPWNKDTEDQLELLLQRVIVDLRQTASKPQESTQLTREMLVARLRQRSQA